MKCLTCRSIGFERSKLGPHRCTFCDGTEAGNPPSETDIQESARLIQRMLLEKAYG